jgi:hypothetical protein
VPAVPAQIYNQSIIAIHSVYVYNKLDDGSSSLIGELGEKKLEAWTAVFHIGYKIVYIFVSYNLNTETIVQIYEWCAFVEGNLSHQNNCNGIPVDCILNILKL